MMKNAIFFAAAMGLAALPVEAAVLDEVTFDIQEGWNAIYLPVTPEGSADKVFANWPTDKVGFYDQAAFLRTKQFETKADDSTLGAVENGMKIWMRDNPGASSFHSLVANGIYVFNATQEVRRTVCGVPMAMRVLWHVCVSTNQPLNLVGFSTDGNDAVLTATGYFQGLDTGWTHNKSVLRDVWGFMDDPSLDFFYGEPTKPSLGVVAMDAAKESDWSGVFFVSPATGLDFGTNVCQGTISVRNDAGTNRTVRVTLRRMDAQTCVALPLLDDILFVDPARHAVWQTNLVAKGYERELLAGETLSLRIAIDRTQFGQIAAGTEYGGLLSVTDVSSDNPSHFRTTVPFSFRSDGGVFLRSRWPKGLWSATLSLDQVADKKAGATMTMRVLVHVDANGAMTLLQRARVNGRRVSSVVLPTDAPTVAGAGTFGARAAFAWKVADTSRANPFRHARHPDHDGLDAYFERPLPSGDDFSNYNTTVKPELFSVENELTLDWDAATSAAPWSPEETLSGACTWKLSGLRREGAITTTGRFVMRRISEKDLNEIED